MKKTFTDNFEIGENETSLSQRVFKKLQNDILEGRYKTGDKMVELAISKDLGVSRTPIREALRQLELEGLVKSVHNKGIYVTNITEKDVNDIYVIRSLIEGQCAYWACENINEEQLERLEENIYLREFHLQKGNLEQILKLDNEFHKILYEASASKILKNILTDLHKYVVRVRRMSLNDLSRAKMSVREHSKIVDAIKGKNPDRARELATLHTINSMRSIKSKLKE